MNIEAGRAARRAPLATRSNLSQDAVHDLSAGLTALLADTFALYLKTFIGTCQARVSAITIWSWTSRRTSCSA
jgi:hypothetical protein